jgi:signal transduction histidine kinase
MGARVERDTITLYVRDRGPGIDPREIPHLFEKFYRGGDHMTREVGGTGLGLSIVHHIASAHGGRVAVHSKLGEGSTFEILLPVQTVEEVNSGAARR